MQTIISKKFKFTCLIEFWKLYVESIKGRSEMITFFIKKKEEENGIHSLNTGSMKRAVAIQP